MAEFSNLNGYDVKDKKAIRTFDTVADMKADENLKAGQCVATLGYYSVNDGGSSLYKIRDKNESETTDNMFTVELNNNLISELLFDEKINIKQMGARVDDESATVLNTSIIHTCFDKDVPVFIPKGTFYVNKITVNGTKKLIGEEYRSSILKYNGQSDESALYIKGYGAYIEKISVLQNASLTNVNAIEFGDENPAEIIIKECYINVNGNGIIGGFNGHLNNITITDCFIENCTNGINMQYYNLAQINAIFIERNIIRKCSNAGILFYGNNVIIEENSIQLNKYGIEIGEPGIDPTEYKEQDCQSSCIVKNYFEQNSTYTVYANIGYSSSTYYRLISKLLILGNFLHGSEKGIYINATLRNYNFSIVSDISVSTNQETILKGNVVNIYPKNTIEQLSELPYNTLTNNYLYGSGDAQAIVNQTTTSGVTYQRRMGNTQTRIIIYNRLSNAKISGLKDKICQSIIDLFINGYRDFGSTAQFSFESKINGIGGRMCGTNTEIKTATSPIISPLTYFENNPKLQPGTNELNVGFQLISRNINVTNFNYFVNISGNRELLRGYFIKVTEESTLDETNDISSVTPSYLGQLIFNTTDNKWYYAKTLSAWEACN